MLKDRTLLCISYSICPTIYVNKHLSRLTYGRAPAKGSNPVVTRNRRIGLPIPKIWQDLDYSRTQMYDQYFLKITHIHCPE